MKDKRYQEITGIVLIIFAVILFLSIFTYNIDDYTRIENNTKVSNLIGPLGALISHGVRSAFGVVSYLVVLICGMAGWEIMNRGTFNSIVERVLYIFYMIITLSAFVALYSSNIPQHAGGYVGQLIYSFLESVSNTVGAFIIILLLNIIGLILIGFISLAKVTALKEKQGSAAGTFGQAARRLLAKKKSMKSTIQDVPKNTIEEDFIRREEDLQNQKISIPWLTRLVGWSKGPLPWITRKTINIQNDSKNLNESEVPKLLENNSVTPLLRDDTVDKHEPVVPEPILFKREKIIELKENEYTHTYDEFPQQEDSVDFFDDIQRAGDNYVENSQNCFREKTESILESNLDTNNDIFESDNTITAENDEALRSVENNGADESGERYYIDENIDAGIADDINEVDAPCEETSQEIITGRIKHIDSENDTVLVAETSGSAPVNITEDLDNNDDFDSSDIDLSRNTPLVFDRIKLKGKYFVPVEFLDLSETMDSESFLNEIKKNSALLVNTLADFGIESKVVNVERGPVITLYEVQIAPGIKVNRIVGLSDDIAMALAVYRVRIVAPIPGKSAIGVEIPNKKREMVTLGDIIHSNNNCRKSEGLKVALGKDILGKPVILDLKKLPHLLIAGATGSGKSVCVNTIITSLIYNYDPNYVRFILVDPKMVELQLYNGLSHLLTPVITEPHTAPNALKWAMYEMERRYRLLSELNTRDITRYNEKVKEQGGGYEHLPYIVTIIDELADLMMVASKEIEGFITRIAQKARAVGIHLVLATQRPSVDIITGIIKANIPARIAFQVAQKTDSRTIMDQNGAEKLLGKGDLLYQSPMGAYPVRIQGAFISEDEIMKIVKHLRQMGEPDYIDIEESLMSGELTKDTEEDVDELFVDALKIVEETRKASASYLQRRLSIGYNRAARIIELMEDRGYVGPQQGSKPRDVFI